MLQEVQSGLKEKWQQKLQDAEQKRNDLLPEHQRLQKRFQKIQSIRDKKRNMLKRCGRSERKSIKKRSAFVCCRTRSIRIETSGQGMKEEAAMPPKLPFLGTVAFRYGNGSGEALVRSSVPNVPQKIRDPHTSCANARKRRKRGE